MSDASLAALGMHRRPCQRCGQPHLEANGPICLGCQARDLPANPTGPDDDRLTEIADWLEAGDGRAAKLIDLLHCWLAEHSATGRHASV